MCSVHLFLHVVYMFSTLVLVVYVFSTLILVVYVFSTLILVVYEFDMFVVAVHALSTLACTCTSCIQYTCISCTYSSCVQYKLSLQFNRFVVVVVLYLFFAVHVFSSLHLFGRFDLVVHVFSAFILTFMCSVQFFLLFMSL